MSAKSGLTLDQHRHAGARLAAIRNEVLQLGVQAANAWPKRSRPSRALLKALRTIDDARSDLDSALFNDHPAQAQSDIYYPGAGR